MRSPALLFILQLIQKTKISSFNQTKLNLYDYQLTMVLFFFLMIQLLYKKTTLKRSV